MSGSLESVRWNAFVHRLDLGLYSHCKEFWGNGVRTHVNSKGKNPLHQKNSSQRRMEPMTLHQVIQQAQHTSIWRFHRSVQRVPVSLSVQSASVQELTSSSLAVLQFSGKVRNCAFQLCRAHAHNCEGFFFFFFFFVLCFVFCYHSVFGK